MTACLVGLAIALQVLTAIGLSPRPFPDPNGGAALFASTDSVACAKWRNGGHSGDREHDFDECCIFCGGHDTNSATTLLSLAAGKPFEPRRAASSLIPAAAAPATIPAGWASAWSSRAPPHLS